MAATDDCVSSARLLASKNCTDLKFQDGLKQLNLESMKEEVTNVLRLFLEVDNETLQEKARTSAFKIHDIAMALMTCRDKKSVDPLQKYIDSILPDLISSVNVTYAPATITHTKTSASDLGDRVAVELEFRTSTGINSKVIAFAKK